ncbi:MAG TPA: GIY-YIG nuclease family protein [Armatimonadota bacterium]|jgi:hypothetical protein
MDRKKELKQQYKEMKTEAGVYQIKNTVNGKVWVKATPNLKTINGQLVQLRIGSHRNPRLQEAWNLYGEDAFVFEVLEMVPETAESTLARQRVLKELEKKWLEKQQPFGEYGYN